MDTQLHTDAVQYWVSQYETPVPNNLNRQELHEMAGVLIAALREARHTARLAHDFIQEGCFGDDLAQGEVGSPEFELYVRWMAYRHAADDCPWLKEKLNAE